MRASDWSRQILLRSDWLGLLVATMTTDMVQERLQKRPKVEYEETIGRFVFP